MAKFNNDTEMIICVHCKNELTIAPTNFPRLVSHRCSASGMKKEGRIFPKVYSRLFTQSTWCPSKDSCEAMCCYCPER
jgi:hypothetical protein